MLVNALKQTINIHALSQTSQVAQTWELEETVISWIGGSLNLRDHMNRPDYFALFAWNLCTCLFSTAQWLPLNSLCFQFFAAASAIVTCYPNNELHR